MNTAIVVAIAVNVTDKAMFPFANDDIKFEIFPPGHAATSIIPIAILGVGLIKRTNRKVKKVTQKIAK